MNSYEKKMPADNDIDKKKMVQRRNGTAKKNNMWIVYVATAIVVAIVVLLLWIIFRAKQNDSSEIAEPIKDSTKVPIKSSDWKDSSKSSESSTDEKIPTPDCNIYRLKDTSVNYPRHMDGRSSPENSYVLDGHIGRAWLTSVDSDMVPLYRLRSSNSTGGYAGRHMTWTSTSYNVSDQGQNPSMVLDSSDPLFWGYSYQKKGTVPLYVLYTSFSVGEADFMTSPNLNESVNYRGINNFRPICYVMPV
jgi:hypothetical protein